MLAQHCALIGEAAALIGDPQVRHRGTIGGSVAHGDPASDLGTILLTLDADFVARGPDGERTIPAAEFFTGPFETALGPQEVLTEIRVPKVASGTYLKHVRRAQDWATVGVAAARVDGRVQVGLDEHGGDAAAGAEASRRRSPAAPRRPTPPRTPPTAPSRRAT